MTRGHGSESRRISFSGQVAAAVPFAARLGSAAFATTLHTACCLCGCCWAGKLRKPETCSRSVLPCGHCHVLSKCTVGSGCSPEGAEVALCSLVAGGGVPGAAGPCMAGGGSK